MKVWIINKENNNEKELSRKLLSYIYHQETKKIFDFSKLFYGKYGKPYYVNNFYYNISHSKNYICIVISNSEVGIDIEEERKFSVELKKKILTIDELADNNIDLIEYWNIKEAYSKYKGMGLFMNFNEVSVSKIKQIVNIYNLSSDKYYCSVVGKEILEKVNFLNINDLIFY